jgi:hypothetical protein
VQTDHDTLMTMMANRGPLRSRAPLSMTRWLLLTLLFASCSREPLLPPDLGLACTMTGPSACKPGSSVSLADGMSMPDAVQLPDAMSGPLPCASDSDCVMSCVMGALGCKCATVMTGSKQCVPICSVTADCPKPPMGTVSCDTTRGVCLVMR